MDIIDDVYTGSVYMGQIRATLGAIVGTVISIILLFIGIRILYFQYKLLADQDAIVDLDTVDGHTLVTYHDTAGKAYTYNFPSSGTYKKNDKITVYYYPDNPQEAQIEIPSKSLGWFCIGGAVLLLLISWGLRWLSFHFTPFASFEAVSWFV